MLSEHGEPGAVLTLQMQQESLAAARDVLDSLRPELLQCLQHAIQQGQSGHIAAKVHLSDGTPQRVCVETSHTTKLD